LKTGDNFCGTFNSFSSILDVLPKLEKTYFTNEVVANNGRFATNTSF
jgi:hypothetical protein